MMCKKLLSLLIVFTLLFSALPLAAQAAAKTGDADRNGRVNIGDVTCIQRWLNELLPADSIDLKAADVNRDGSVTIEDATVIQRVLAEFEAFEEPSLDVCLASEPDTLDPALNSSVDGATMLSHLFSGLAKYAQKPDGTLEIVPDAAETLPEGVENADGTVTYTYTLRDNLKWSDGVAVKAADFAFAWQRAASVELFADYSYLFEVIDGYNEMWELDEYDRPVNPEATLNVSAPDDKTLVVTLNSDVAYWNELLAFPAFFPVREDVAADSAWADSPEAYVCNGLYTLEGWEHDSLITLKKNENHPDADNVTMDTIRFWLSADSAANYDRFINGSLQFIDDVPDIAAAKTAYPEEFHTAGQLGTYYACWNVNEEILPSGTSLTGAAAENARAEIRRALSLLIDRSHIVNDITQGGQAPASSFVAMGITDADGSQFYQNCGVSTDFDGYFDPARPDAEQAVAVLKKYYTYDEKAKIFTNAPQLSYLTTASPAHRAIAAHIQEEFGKIGITLTIKEVDWVTYIRTRMSGGFSMERSGWLADYNDPLSFLDMWTTTSGNNDAFLGSGAHASTAAYSLDLTPYGYDVKVENGTWAQTYDVLISVIKGCKDKTTRYKLMHLAEDMLMNTGCVMPIYYYTDVYMLNKNVKGFFASPLGYKYFMYTTIEP